MTVVGVDPGQSALVPGPAASLPRDALPNQAREDTGTRFSCSTDPKDSPSYILSRSLHSNDPQVDPEDWAPSWGTATAKRVVELYVPCFDRVWASVSDTVLLRPGVQPQRVGRPGDKEGLTLGAGRD